MDVASRSDPVEIVVAGKGWGDGGPARRDPQFYARKRAWEKQHGRAISTTEFREKHWPGMVGIVNNLTFVKGERETGDLDPVSQAILDVGSGTSIFDPVLCEVAYRWFCPPGGTVLDPFAGGSVRGIVASRLGRRYVGIELREEQVAANMAQLYLADGPKPQWRVGDAREIARHAADVEADLVFSCPPYWNLERYSDDPADLSNMGREEFFAAYGAIIRDALARLRDDRFAVWVVGDVRAEDGGYVNLPGRTVEAFEAAGARFYNDAILVTAVGSLPVRAGRQFDISRKLGRTHQNVMVFVKGDPRRATEACGPVEFGEIDAEGEMPA
jgi:DNA modification methylase